MKKEKIYAKCDVRGQDILVDENGNGDDCPNCGWRQSEESFYHRDIAGIRNIPSLISAIKQYKQGKSAILANFNDFVMAYENYGELEFTYKGVRFGLLYDDEQGKYMLLNILTGEKQYFMDIVDFQKNAKIDGVFLKDLWESVTQTDFLQ